MSAAACAGSASCAARRRARLLCLIAALWLVAAGVADPSPASADDTVRQTFLKLEQARVALMRGQHSDADRLLTEAIFSGHLSPDTLAFALGHRALARTHLGKHRAAIHDFNTAISLSPEDATFYNNRGNLLLEIGLYTEAVKDFDQAISLLPSYGAAYNNRGNALISLGDYAEAIADFARAIELMPMNAAPFNGRGKAELALGRPAGALRDFSRAIELNGRYSQAYINRAEALTAIHRYHEAIGDLSVAISIGGGEAQLYRARASLYAALKMQALALADLAEARRLDPAATADSEGATLADEAIIAAIAIPTASRSVDVLPCKDGPTAALVSERSATVADAPRATSLYRSASAQSDGRADPAVLAYRTALNCITHTEGDPEPLAQLASAEEDDAYALAAQIWRIERSKEGAYITTHPEHPEFSLRLEMYGSGEPELLHWQELEDPLGGIGLLHYRAGVSSNGETLEYVAVIDTLRERLLAVEPASWGGKRATWTWSETELVVVDPQGVPSRVQLNGELSRKLYIKGGHFTVSHIKRPSRKHRQTAKRPRLRAVAATRVKLPRRSKAYSYYDGSNYRRRVPPRFNPYSLRNPGAYAYRPYR